MHMYDNEYAFLLAYIYMYICILNIQKNINYKFKLIHTLNWQISVIMNKWTVLKLLQNFEFLLSKKFLYTNYNVN